MKKYVTEISEKNFRQMNLKGYKHVKVSIDENSYRMGWEEVSINDVLNENLKDWDKWFPNDPKVIVIAIHNDSEKAIEYEKIWNASLEEGNYMVRNNLPDDFYYMDKWLNRSGATTYQIGCAIEHIYITRDYFETRDGDYWRVRKDETESIFLIHLED